MRLVKPTFSINLPLLCESTDLPYNHNKLITNEHDNSNHNTNKNVPYEACGFSSLLSLPHSFGSIYLGETFSSYISINNPSQSDVTNVVIKAELQTQTKRFNLLDLSTKPISVFEQTQNHDFVVSHPVSEEGVHILVCNVNYLRPDAEKTFFRKYFKFQVNRPLNLQVKTKNLMDSVFMELQIQNLTQSGMIIKQISLRQQTEKPFFSFNEIKQNNSPTSSNTASTTAITTSTSSAGSVSSVTPYPFYCSSSSLSLNKSLSLQDSPNIRTTSSGNIAPLVSDNGQEENREMVYMKPHVICNFLFRLDPLDERAKVSTSLGRIEVVWGSAFGDSAVCQSENINRTVPGRKEVELKIVEIPNIVYLEKPFQIICELSNNTDRSIIPRIHFNTMSPSTPSNSNLSLSLGSGGSKRIVYGVVPNGVSGKSIGEILAHGKRSISLSLFPLLPGLQKIGGIQLEFGQNKKIEFDDIFDVFVEAAPLSIGGTIPNIL